MKMNYFHAALCVVGLSLLTCAPPNSDPFGCNSRGPLVISDVNMKNGNLNHYYNEFITGSNGYWLRQAVDSTLPPGLEAIDSLGIYVRGIPTQIGNYKIVIKVTEYATQCGGRSGQFNANLQIQ